VHAELAEVHARDGERGPLQASCVEVPAQGFGELVVLEGLARLVDE
jgi:hypothetical protein